MSHLPRILMLVLIWGAFAVKGVPQTSVATDTVEADAFAEISPLIQAAIEEGQMPGAVVGIADHDGILYLRAFGDRRVEPERVPMTVDSVFDLASITKPVATALSVMRLQQDGVIELDAPVSRYLPEFAENDKATVTVKQLLVHTGGLIPDNSLKDYRDGDETTWQRICELKLRSAPGEKFSYSDVGFIVLGKLVERVSGQRLDRYAAEHVFIPLGMSETMFLPSSELRQRAVPTEKASDGESWICGSVHDPRAAAMGGVAGHAGLFSTAGDLLRLGQSFLPGNRDRHPVLNRETIDLMSCPVEVPRGTRMLGWDHRSPYSSNRGESLSDAAFGHGGFTGTVIWIDPELDRVFVFLSSRLHPDGKGSVNGLAGQIATIIGNEAKK
ncbi:serine hydrolase domain-containing protein [Stieleria varia]|uniref:serine hydrolase domain-containing protein n=1 Tax=Stieleria varia TaxID=2528005 RepID=UPI0018D20477|nr:serine hydrolase domain-containing protein [Stieleria varia]